MKKAVILLSGGLDSATCLAIAIDSGFLPYALSFRYGQRHEFELDSAKAVSKSMGVEEHIILDIDLRAFGGSALTMILKFLKIEMKLILRMRSQLHMCLQEIQFFYHLD